MSHDGSLFEPPLPKGLKGAEALSFYAQHMDNPQYINVEKIGEFFNQMTPYVHFLGGLMLSFLFITPSIMLIYYKMATIGVQLVNQCILQPLASWLEDEAIDRKLKIISAICLGLGFVMQLAAT